MSTNMDEAKTEARAIAPVLCVTAMDETLGYLVDRLGFRIGGTAGDPMRWASVLRDQVEIMLIRGDYPPPARDWAAYVYVRGVDDLFGEFQQRGADLVGPPRNTPYDNREIEVRLPDGRVLVFAEDLLSA